MLAKIKKRSSKMLNYSEDFTSYDAQEDVCEKKITNSDACARIIVDLAVQAKRAINMNCKILLRMKIEDMLLRTIGMIDYKEIEDRAEEMIETICDALDVSVKHIISCVNDYFSGRLQALVEELVTHRFDTIETMLNDVLYHEKAVIEKFQGRYESFGSEK